MKNSTNIEEILDSGEHKGHGVLEQNIEAARGISDFIDPTLGPLGSNKLLHNLDENQKEYMEVSNQGSFLLKRIKFEQPAAEMIVNTAASQEKRVGDGTTTTAIYAGEILHQIKPLLEKGIHPTTIIRGLDSAQEEACRALDNLSTRVTLEDQKILEDIALTSLSGGIGSQIQNRIIDWIVDATLEIAQVEGESVSVDPDCVHTESLRSGSLQDSRLIKGMALKKSYAGWHNPNSIKKPKIALITEPFEKSSILAGNFNNKNIDIKYNSTKNKIDLYNSEINIIKKSIEPLIDADIDVVFVEGSVENEILPYFDQAGIAVVRNARIDRMKQISRATGAKINKHIQEFQENDSGGGEEIIQENLNGKNLIIIKNGYQKDTVALLIRGSTWMSGWEVQRNINNAIHALAAALEVGKVVPGGGATEITLANQLRAFSSSKGGRESLVVEVVADAFESIPKWLARNAGMDPLSTLTRLRNNRFNGEPNVGIICKNRMIDNTIENGIVEPQRTKENSIKLGVSTTSTILRIDDVIDGIDATAKYKSKL